MVKVGNGDLVKSFDLPKAMFLEFSPLNKVLVTWKHYTSGYTIHWVCYGTMGRQCCVCDLLFIIHLLSLIKKNCQLVPHHTGQAFKPAQMLFNFYALHTSKH